VGPTDEANVEALHKSVVGELQFNVRWVAMCYDMVNMAIDTGLYGDELEQHALDRIEEISAGNLLPEHWRLVEAHRKYPPPQ